MARPVRTKFQRERDLEIITALYLECYSQYEIPKILKERTGASYLLSRNQITYDIKTIRAGFKKKINHDLEEERNTKLAEVRNLKKIYLDSWMNSRKSSEDKTGDPKYLAGVQWCIDKECDLLGVEARDLTDPETQKFRLIVESIPNKSVDKKQKRRETSDE